MTKGEEALIRGVVGSNLNWLNGDAVRSYLSLMFRHHDWFVQAANAREHEIQQTLGKVLGYPWYKDDPENFPDAKEADGVCVGEHTSETLASEAAALIAKLQQQVKLNLNTGATHAETQPN